jgi:hypothetical protein
MIKTPLSEETRGFITFTQKGEKLSPSKLWIKLKYSFEFIADFEIFSHFPKPGSLQNLLMPRSMLSKLKGGV